jgi:hypothetical protein
VKCLTVRQPHAQLIVLGPKRIETRSWATKYRGPLVIHAGKHEPAHIKEVPLSSEGVALYDALAEATGREDYGWLPLGAIIGSCNLVDVVRIYDGMPAAPTQPPFLCNYRDRAGGQAARFQLELWGALPGGGIYARYVTDQRPYGDFTPGRYAWLLEDIQPVEKRCPACWGRNVCGQHYQVAVTDEQCADCAERMECDICLDRGICYHIPAKGKQGIWEWNP